MPSLHSAEQLGTESSSEMPQSGNLAYSLEVPPVRYGHLTLVKEDPLLKDVREEVETSVKRILRELDKQAAEEAESAKRALERKELKDIESISTPETRNALNELLQNWALEPELAKYFPKGQKPNECGQKMICVIEHVFGAEAYSKAEVEEILGTYFYKDLKTHPGIMQCLKDAFNWAYTKLIKDEAYRPFIRKAIQLQSIINKERSAEANKQRQCA